MGKAILDSMPPGATRPDVHPPGADEVERAILGRWTSLTSPVARGAIALLRRGTGFRYAATFEQPFTVADGPLLFASNHCSHADTGAITGTLPHGLLAHTLVAAAMDTFGRDSSGRLRRVVRPLVQFAVASAFHAFPFDRMGHSLQSLRTSIRLVSRGWSLLLYPEGTRSRTGRLGTFKPGIGLLAHATGRPVVPVHVEGSRQVLPCGAHWPRRGTIHVRYGQPMHIRDDETPAAFASRVQAAVQRLAGHA